MKQYPISQLSVNIFLQSIIHNPDFCFPARWLGPIYIYSRKCKELSLSLSLSHFLLSVNIIDIFSTTVQKQWQQILSLPTVAPEERCPLRSALCCDASSVMFFLPHCWKQLGISCNYQYWWCIAWWPGNWANHISSFLCNSLFPTYNQYFASFWVPRSQVHPKLLSLNHQHFTEMCEAWWTEWSSRMPWAQVHCEHSMSPVGMTLDRATWDDD